jgi:hypothetical protein
MPKDFPNQNGSAALTFEYPGMKLDDVITICVTGAGSTGTTVDAYHLNNPTAVEVSADIDAEDVPGIVNIYGLGITKVVVTPNGVTDTTCSSGHS